MEIFLRRVSRLKEYTQMTHHQNFTDDATANGLIKNGDWKNLVVEGSTLGDIKVIVREAYDLDDSIVDRIILKYLPF